MDRGAGENPECAIPQLALSTLDPRREVSMGGSEGIGLGELASTTYITTPAAGWAYGLPWAYERDVTLA
jgi:hypothetical protein